MRLALIDIGTNSIRLDIYIVYPDGQVERLKRVKEMVRLGQDVFLSSALHPEGIKRTIKALDRFKQICVELCVDEIRAIATSAVRDSKNAETFVKKVRQKLDIAIEVISGKEEAMLILEGIKQDWRAGQSTFGFIDIGGGSTEIGILTEKRTIFLDSLPLGASRLQQKFFLDSTSTAQVGECRRYIIQCLKQTFKDVQIPAIPLMLGSSGTVGAIEKVFKSAGKSSVVQTKPLTDLVSRLAELSLADRKKFPGLSAKRADIIVPGALILNEVMLYLRTPDCSLH
jgi:exopolyphosphatase/guanosine-5'-triphosphate,3'-diphosphate pyrophosphatase